MENTSYVALSRQTALWRQLEVVANNIANMNTTGYRGKDVMFTDYLVKSTNDDSPFRDEIRFVQDFGIAHDTSPGPVSQTGNPMDLALERDGYFVVETAQGPLYTRAGRLSLDDQGQLVTAEGHPVLTENDTPVFVAPNESQFTVARDGTISTENGPIGKLRVVDFEEPQRLKDVGASLFQADDGQDPVAVENPAIAQGMIEGSNVNGVVEMTKMIDIQRSYGHVQNLLDKENERISRAMQTWTRQTA
jgi:flagellar basal-body rod protein FlgF